jgi:hypothetical protein
MLRVFSNEKGLGISILPPFRPWALVVTAQNTRGV